MNILILRQLDNSWELPLTLFVRGLRKTRSVLFALHPTKDCIIDKTLCALLVCIILLRRNRTSPTVVLAPSNKVTTWRDKSHFSNINSLATKLLQTLGLELIGKGRVLKPYWNELCKEISMKLWSPIETGCVGSHLISSRISSNSVMSNSLFSTMETMNPELLSSPMTSYLSSPSIPADKWVEEDIRVRRIRMYPSKAQASVLRQWTGTTRYVYNRTLSYIRDNPSAKISFIPLRDRFVNNPDPSVVKDWELLTPSEVRRYAVKDLVTAHKAAFSNLKRHNITKFKLNYRSKKRGESSIGLPKSACKVLNIKRRRFITLYPTVMKKSMKGQKLDCRIRLSHDRALKHIGIVPAHDIRVHDIRVHCIDNRWYLCIPVTIKFKKSEASQEFCSLDPGTRKFQTIFANDRIREIRPNEVLLKKLEQKLRIMNQLRSSKPPKILKSHYVRRVRRIHYRISNLVDSMHYALRTELISNYGTIFLPSFESQELVKVNKGRNFRREVLRFKHYQFKMRMLDKADLIQGCRVVVCTEEYTSKTCSECGRVKNIGASEIYN